MSVGLILNYFMNKIVVNLINAVKVNCLEIVISSHHKQNNINVAFHNVGKTRKNVSATAVIGAYCVSAVSGVILIAVGHTRVNRLFRADETEANTAFYKQIMKKKAVSAMGTCPVGDRVTERQDINNSWKLAHGC